MKRILIICFGKLQHDARVSRQVDFLKSMYSVTLAAFDALPDPKVEYIQINRPTLTLFRKALVSVPLLLRMHSIAYQMLHGHDELRKKLSGRSFDLIVANDIESLPLAFDLFPDGNVLFDAHEYAPRHFEDKRSWRIFFQSFNTHLCRKYIPKVKAMTTVGSALAREYQRHFGLEPVILTNATSYHAIDPSPVQPNSIRMIHHGGATVSRKLELLVELMKHLDSRFTLDFMLIVPEFASSKTLNYINYLKGLAASDQRIRFLPALRSNEIVPFINQYDLGVFLLPPVNFNYANTLPNKLFDFIQARLGIAIGPTPEMAEVVTKYKIGVVSREFTVRSLAAELNRLTGTDVFEFKKRAGQAAADLNAEKNKEILLKLVSGIIGQ